jgi:hypothetical protein
MDSNEETVICQTDIFFFQTLIYQPSNMPRPIQRESVDSVGDNFTLRPNPAHGAGSQRSSVYNTIDTDTPVSISKCCIHAQRNFNLIHQLIQI